MVQIDILLKSRNSDRELIQSIKTTERTSTRIEKKQQFS